MKMIDKDRMKVLLSNALAAVDVKPGTDMSMQCREHFEG